MMLNKEQEVLKRKRLLVVCYHTFISIFLSIRPLLRLGERRFEIVGGETPDTQAIIEI